MLTPHQGFTYNKYIPTSEYYDIENQFDYKIDNGLLLKGNKHIYLSGSLNYEVSGDTSCIVDGIFTRTSNSPILSISIPSADRESFKTKDWEIGTYIDLTSVESTTIDNNLNFIGGRYNYKIGANESWMGLFGAYINTTSTEFTYFYGDNPYDVHLENNPYWIKFGRSGNLVYLSCSLDNINWQTTKWINITASENASDTFYILQSQSATTNSWVGAKIDLKQTYIKLDHNLYIYGKINTTNNIIPVPNNFTYGNTTTSSIGYVDVRTQEFTPSPIGSVIVKDDQHYRQVQTYQEKGTVNYTTIGNIINSDGIISNFANDSYICIPAFRPDLYSWEVNIDFTYVQKTSENQSLFGTIGTIDNQGLYIQINEASGHKMRWCISSNGTSWDLVPARIVGPVLINGDSYKCKVTYDGINTYRFYLSHNGGDFELIDSEISSDTIYLTNTEKIIGNNKVYDQPFLGTVNLNNTYIKINNIYWFKPYINSYVKLIGTTDYVTYGSPTIENGILSNTDGSNCIQINGLNAFTNWEFNTRVTLGNGSETFHLLYGINEFINTYITAIGSFRMESPADNYSPTSSVYLYPNATYDVKLLNNNGQFSMTATNVNDQTNTETITLSSNNPNVAQILYLGRSWSPSAKSYGSIDLNNTYIKVNDKLWFGKEDWTPCIYENNAIYLSVLEDSNRNYLGFNPTISNSGNYDVYIDNQKIVEEKSGQTSIDWGYLNLDTGYTNNNINYHTLKICPSIKTNNITSYKASRVQSSGYENQGIVRAIIACDNIDLSNAFETNNEVKNSNLKSVESYSSELNVIAIKEMSTVNELEHIDSINNTSNASISLSKAINSSDIKYINLKGNFNSEGYKFSNNTSLEKIDTEEVLQFNNNDFENNYNLRILPKGIINESNLTNFITNTSNLYPTNMNINFNSLSKLDIYGSTSHFISNINNITVSNESPFDSTISPQLNVSYTGLDKTALINLFNSLPYNVGYTVVGSPTIVDGIVTYSTYDNCPELSSTFQFAGNEIEIVAKCSHGIGLLRTSGSGSVNYTLSFNGGYFNFFSGSNIYWGPGATQSDEYVRFYKSADGSITELCVGDGSTWNKVIKNDVSYTNTVSGPIKFAWYVNEEGEYADLNETYIKVNGIPWFRGKEATIKTINIIGCTGTNDLTQEDKNIAINKGWSLTLS